MLELTAKIHGKTQQDLESCLEEMLRRLKAHSVTEHHAVIGTIHENDGSETSSFDLVVTLTHGTTYSDLVKDPYGERHSEAYHH